MKRAILTVIVGVALTASACSGQKSAEAPSTVSSGPSKATTPPPAEKSTPTPSRPRPFDAKITKIPSRATVKYSWHPGCPVGLSDLRLITMTYWGMDDESHDGKMIVNAKVAHKIVKVFHTLYKKRYPIRRMELVDEYKGSDFQSIEADNTSAFNCRSATGSSSWSQHAYGLAIDLNTCENPYVHSNGHIEHPDCVKYGKRSRHAPGMIHDGDKVVKAFASIGWGWGGNWDGPWDYQHFSANGH